MILFTSHTSALTRRRERNPEAVIEVLKFCQEVHGDPWEKTSPPPNRVQHPDLGVVPPRPPKPDKPTHPPPRPAALDLKSSDTYHQVPPQSLEKHDSPSWEWLSPSRPAPPPPSSSPTSPAPSWYTRPTVSHDRSQSQPTPSSPLPQPEVTRSRSQRDAPHATKSPLAPPMLPPIIPSLSLDYPTSQRAPPLPLPQSAAARSVSQRNRSHPPAGPRLPPAPTVSGKKTVQDPDKEVAPPRPAIASFDKHTGAKPDVTNQSSHVLAAEITSLMTPSEVIAHLGTRGCPDLGDQLDEGSCSKYPISNGGYGDIYRAKLKNGTEVAIKTMRLLLDAEGQKHIKHAAL
ncbi:hypothetical protein FS749_014963 [Ceratobasidium sp. UAMH 11750]|nr:hypothetical protein FS749_014963 [Ceratobasidium sp. UAMH 11750]